MSIDLQNKIESIAVQIIEKYKPEKIILFGSSARERLSADSDVDLLIIKKDVLTPDVNSGHEALSHAATCLA